MQTLPLPPRGRPSIDPIRRAAYDAQREAARIAGTYSVPSRKVIITHVPIIKKDSLEHIIERFDVVNRLVEGAINGFVRSVIISGPSGISKTHTIEGMLKEAEEAEVIKYGTTGGKCTPINLYKILYKYREKNCILLVDDDESLYEEEDSLNMLKHALDTGSKRMISWLTESKTLKDEGIPNTFEFKGAIIFITNKDMQAMVDAKHRMSPHFAALQDRSHYVDLGLRNVTDLLMWVAYLVQRDNIVVKRGATHEQQLTILEWIKQHATQIRSLSIRTATKLADYMLTDMNNWETMARVTVLNRNKI